MKNGCKVITISQQKGGAGKTTIAAHLAVALMQKRNKVAIIDIDPQGSLTHWHSIRAGKFGADYTGLHFSATAGWRINSEISNLKREYDYIIIDSPPHTETDSKSAIRVADLLLIPVQPSPTDLWATRKTIGIAKNERIPYFVILNRVNNNSKLAGEVLKELDNPLNTQLANRVAFAACMMEGKCVTELHPTSAAALEIKALADEVTKALHPVVKKKDRAA